MTVSTTYPNGQTLVSSALTPAQVSAIVQVLTCGVLGINPVDYSQVRVDWQTQGQPFVVTPAQDACFIACTPQDVNYSRVRDRQYGNALSGGAEETWTYTKGWRIAWCFYGPNGEDHARAVRSAMFMDYANDQFNVNELYPISDPPEVTRTPENFNAQWYERADFYIDCYEQVTETIQDGAATSVEIKVSADTLGQVADFTVKEQ
jgi:hypothetical protein